MKTAKSSKSKSTFQKRGGYSGSALKSLPKVKTPAPTAKGNGNNKGSTKTKS